MLSDYGKVIRKARVETGETLSTMAKSLQKTVSFLSATETGRKKIPMDLVPKIKEYLINKGAKGDDINKLELYASIANEELSLTGLDINRQKAVVKFAKSELTQEKLNEIMKILDLED